MVSQNQKVKWSLSSWEDDSDLWDITLYRALIPVAMTSFVQHHMQGARECDAMSMDPVERGTARHLEMNHAFRLSDK